MIEPQAADAAAWLDDAKLFQHFMLILGSAVVKVAMNEETNVITPFANHNAGMLILFHTATSGDAANTYPPRGPARLSVKDMARRFHVSRTHVLHLLRKVEKLGLIRRDAEQVTGVIAEDLRKGIQKFHAVQMLGISACLALARQAAGAQAAAAQ